MKQWILMGAAAWLAGCGHAPQQVAANAPSPVAETAPGRYRFAPDSPLLQQLRTAPVQTAEVPLDEVVAPGKIEADPNRVSRVALPLAGRITAVEVRLGDTVQQGQVLFRIESPEAEEATKECIQTEAGQARAAAALSKARADHERLSDLLQRGATAKKEVLNAEAELARAESDLKEAQAAAEQTRRKLAILGLKPGEFGQQVVVRAPIGGKVMEISAAPGEYRTDTSAPLLTIADLRTVWVTSDIPESSIRMIEPGERVQIDLAAYPDEHFQGRVMRLADTVDPQTRTVRVHTELDNRAGRFRPEMFARIRHSHATRAVPVVPPAAILRNAGGAWLFVEKQRGEFARLHVEAGDPVRGLIPILSGLEPGARVVVDGAVLLQGGQP